MVGVFTMALGLLKLGFLLDFVSAPVLTGWISAVALVILMGQIDSLIGMDVPSGTAEIIRGILGNLHEIQPKTLGIGFGSIFVLLVLEHVGKRWGKKAMWIKILATSRAVVVLVIFTLISYLVNKDRDEESYHWSVTEVDTHGLWTPRVPKNGLLQKVIGRSFAPLIAMAVEHLGVGKAFGLRNGYTIDKSQELFFLGVENLVNSFFGAMTSECPRPFFFQKDYRVEGLTASQPVPPCLVPPSTQSAVSRLPLTSSSLRPSSFSPCTNLLPLCTGFLRQPYRLSL